jgi:chemotaxis response regulator CheB
MAVQIRNQRADPMNDDGPGEGQSAADGAELPAHTDGEMQRPVAEVTQTVSLVVGIGASAGGLEAFKTFFSVMPANSGMAFVLIQHLDPDYPSALVKLLRGCTAMEVLSAEDGMPLSPNRVFVIPPGAVLRLDAGVLRAAGRTAGLD